MEDLREETAGAPVSVELAEAMEGWVEALAVAVALRPAVDRLLQAKPIATQEHQFLLQAMRRLAESSDVGTHELPQH
jgi:hypothetical protein